MFRLAARSVKTPFSARLLSTSAIRPARKQFKAVTSTKAPYITITACALTSAGMYYYLMSKVKNEDEAKDDSEKNAITDAVVEVVDIIDQKTEEVVAEVVEVITNPSTEEEPVAQDAETAPADQSGAFNEETGEINWDCPCLGGMAHGPCGEDFKAAFSCFVYSKEEPKGIECIDKFKAMQDCFRRYPDVYSEELRDDDAEEAQHQQQEQINQEIRATEQAVMNNDIVESVEQAVEEVKEIEQNVKVTAFNLYASAQKKIDDFNKK